VITKLPGVDDVTVLELPDFGPDTSRVSGFTEPGHDVYARLFLPLAYPGSHHYIPWRVVVEHVGLSFDAYTTWDDVVRAAVDQGRGWELPRGTVDDATARSLVGVLARQVAGGVATSTCFALWEGHAGEIDAALRDSSAPVPATGENFLCDGSHRLFTARMDWALTRTDRQHFRFPAAMWPLDRSFLLASALYQDSYYLSCSRATFTAVRAAGLDLLEIDSDVPLPSRGD